MNIELRYFTGTGNSLRILETCRMFFEEKGNHTNMKSISLKETVIQDSDIVSFCFPVYAFGIPRICFRYLKGLKQFKKQQQVFILITAGDKNE